eukprot:5471316-Prymnesium_polylepis.1
MTQLSPSTPTSRHRPNAPPRRWRHPSTFRGDPARPHPQRGATPRHDLPSSRARSLLVRHVSLSDKACPSTHSPLWLSPPSEPQSDDRARPAQVHRVSLSHVDREAALSYAREACALRAARGCSA